MTKRACETPVKVSIKRCIKGLCQAPKPKNAVLDSDLPPDYAFYDVPLSGPAEPVSTGNSTYYRVPDRPRHRGHMSQ